MNISTKHVLLAAALLTAPAHAGAADASCEGLVPAGQNMICAGFEPNWAVELTCSGNEMSANFIDAFSGTENMSTPGTVAFSSAEPWSFETSHGIKGTIAATPGGCMDASDAVHDFTITPAAVPGLEGPFYPFCCRIR